jgi:microcystin-dependent protein
VPLPGSTHPDTVLVVKSFCALWTFFASSGCSLLVGSLDAPVDAGASKIVCIGTELACDDFEGPRNMPGRLVPSGGETGGGTATVVKAQGSTENSVLQIKLPAHTGDKEASASQNISFPATMDVALDLDMRVLANGGCTYDSPTLQFATLIPISGMGTRSESVYTAHNSQRVVMAEQAYAADGTVSYPTSQEALTIPAGWFHVRFELRMSNRTTVLQLGTQELRLPLEKIRSEPRTYFVLGITSSKRCPTDVVLEFDNVVIRAL